jgi:hypothetical protein
MYRPAGLWDLAGMTPQPLTQATSASELRLRIAELQDERLAAVESGLGGNATYMSDLDADLARSRAAYVGMAVSEIASLRASFDGPLVG